jgi:hypothetical protein
VAQSVYVETTVFSFYHDQRTSPVVVAMRDWNCRHLANANKFPHIRRTNTLLGLYVPELVTPLQLMGGP